MSTRLLATARGETKLLLILSVIIVGAFVIGLSLTAALAGAHDATTWLIVAAAYDVTALAVATGLSVFKPGQAFRSRTAPV